jgi:tRNA nucleotidyltransferase/poly(A) polymerase
MADYIYLLENRLSPAQQRAIGSIRGIARENDSTVFLTGGAVRDLTGGGSIRDLDLTLQGDVLKLKKALGNAGVEIVGENAAAQQLFLVFPGGVRVELSSAVSVTWPKPGKPKYEPGNITDDLRRRDFTANAMAISLNEGSYGLLMDPLNGVADIENRELRLVSNYGFIEDPARLIRAARLSSRLGWQMEEKTRQRYDTAKEENYVEALSAWNRGYELEEIFHEEDPVRVLRALEAEGWLASLFPALNATKANTTALADLYERQGQLQIQGILSQAAAVAFPLVTAKLSPADVTQLKEMFVRPGFVREIDSLDTRVKEFATVLSSKEAAAPSAAWRILYAAEPNLVLGMSYGSKVSAVQARLKTFLTESPTARQRIPYALLTEMRINGQQAVNAGRDEGLP